MTLSSPSLEPLSRILLLLPTLGAIYAAFTINKIYSKTKQRADHQTVEVRAVQLGFFGKAVLQITTIFMLFTLIGVLGESPTLNTHPFNPDEQVPKLLIAIGPLLPTTVVLAALFEGLVFTYAMVKNEVFGIDEKLRKGFTTAVFTGAFALLFLFATEAMEAVFDKGWIGGILIGLPFIVLRKPIITSLSKFSNLIMPESFTPQEITYIEMYKAALSDGIITEKERSMLQIRQHLTGSPKESGILGGLLQRTLDRRRVRYSPGREDHLHALQLKNCSTTRLGEEMQVSISDSTYPLGTI